MTIPTRFRSRKFLLAILGQITGLAVLIAGPDHAGAVEQIAQHGGALLLMALTAVGYILGEAKIDASRVQREQGEASARPPTGAAPPALLALLLPAMLLAGGCQGMIQAEPARLFVDSIGDEYEAYIATGLSPEQVQAVAAEPDRAGEIVAEPDFDALQITTRRTFVADFRAYVDAAEQRPPRVFPGLPGSVNEGATSDERIDEPRGPDQQRVRPGERSGAAASGPGHAAARRARDRPHGRVHRAGPGASGQGRHLQAIDRHGARHRGDGAGARRA